MSLTNDIHRTATLSLLLLSVACADKNPLTVENRVATVSISPVALSLTEGDTARLIALTRNAHGDELPGREITWSTSNAAIAVVQNGLVTAVRSGAALVSATSEGATSIVRVDVSGRVAFVNLYPPAAALPVGQSGQMAVMVQDSGYATVVNYRVTWASTDSAVATVGSSGSITAVAAGTASITAAVGEVKAGMRVTVFDFDNNPLVFRSVGTGGNHSCGIAQDARAYCWGDNARGQLGNGFPTSSSTPVAVAGDHRFAELSAGMAYTCGLTTAGAAYCWGDNTWGQLGNAGMAVGGCTDWWCSSTPVLVVGGHVFRSITNGYDHSCAIAAADSEMYCWGWGENGELGSDITVYCNPIGDARCSDVPMLADEGAPYEASAGGFEHGCGVRTSGAALCWGHEHNGQLGRGANPSPGGTPVAVAGGLTFSSIAAGGNSTCGVTANGAYCWGENLSGELGDGTRVTRFAPVGVSGNLSFTSLSVGTLASGTASRTCGIVSGGAGYCWGTNAEGAIGDGTTVDRLVPTAVAGGLAFVSIATGSAHTCGLNSSGTVYCWGGNTFGQLGTGSNIRGVTPVKVVGQGSP